MLYKNNLFRFVKLFKYLVFSVFYKKPYNIIFISITSSKLPRELQKKATNIGLLLAMALRIILLLGISVLIAMKEPWFHIDNALVTAGFSGQSIILILGGIFLLYKT